MDRIYRDLAPNDEDQESAGLLTFSKKGRSAPNLLRMDFPISFSLLALICFWRSSPDERISEGIVGYVPIHISAYSLFSSIWNFVPGVAAAY